MRALRPAIFSMISLSKNIYTARSGGPENLRRRAEESMSPKCFRRLSGRGHSFFESNRNYGYCFFPSLGQHSYTDGKDVFRLISDLLQDVIVLLVQKVLHLFDST